MTPTTIAAYKTVTLNRAEGERLVQFAEDVIEAALLDGASVDAAMDVIAGAARAYAAKVAEALAAARRP